ncbi:MAG: hypothetical protein EOP52_09080 [Sphingobacteriales bacterium]|nr:MAG: hypothetical protein EOP52_09080 [Sphingobacteriales bacterium]
MRIRLHLLAPALLLFAGCQKDDSSTTAIGTDPKTIPVASLSKVAVDYCTDRAVLIEWYVDHPVALQAALNANAQKTDSDTGENDLVRYYNEQTILSPSGQPENFFSLPDDARHQLMRDMIKVDAKLLTEKYAMMDAAATDDREEANNQITDQYFNAVYSDTLNFDAVRASITDANPYVSIRKKRNTAIVEAYADLDNMDPTDSTAPPQARGVWDWIKDAASTTYNTTKTVAINVANISPVTIVANYFFTSSPELTPTEFVNKIRSEMQPGRILLALPAGVLSEDATLFTNGFLDVGHVAIISKKGSDVPATIDENYNISVGTDNTTTTVNPTPGMHYERIKESWTHKHSKAVVMQAFNTVYRRQPDGSNREEKVDYPNGPIYDKILTILNTPYAPLTKMLTANALAPNSFICSSSAWWAIKAAHGNEADITPGFSATWPKDVFKSPKMRVVAKTF